MNASNIVSRAVPSVIQLPAGNVKSLDSGQVLCFAGRVVAVGISPTLFLMTSRPLQSRYPWTLPEQLIDFLAEREATVLRVNISCTEQSHHAGDLQKTAAVWVERFLTVDCKTRLFLLLPPMPPAIFLPWYVLAEDTLEGWQEVQRLADAFSASFPPAMAKLLTDLSGLAQMWEPLWNESLEVAEKQRILTAKDRQAIYSLPTLGFNEQAQQRLIGDAKRIATTRQTPDILMLRSPQAMPIQINNVAKSHRH